MIGCDYIRKLLHVFMKNPKTDINVTSVTQLNSYTTKHRVIRKYLRDFQPLWYSSRDGHAKGEHVNRGRDTPSSCLATHVARVWQELDYRTDICRVTKGGNIEHL